MTEPTDADIESAWTEATGSSILPYPDDMLAFARAVLAKWGTPPAVAGEPDFYTVCARYEDGGEAGWIPLPGYSNETEHGVKHLVLEAARKEGYKGTAAGRLLELGWETRPVFLTPQPTQAQAGAVPLTDEQISLLRFATSSLFHLFERRNNKEIPHCQLMDELGQVVEHVIRRTVAAHGIKGGQHG